MAVDENGFSRGRSLTPLWVISLFLSLTETVVGIGVIQTVGAIQIALTAFVIIFPLLTAFGFFLILWNRPYVFYSPGEYGQQNVRQYVEAMQLRSREESRLFPHIENIVRSQLSSSSMIGELTEVVSRNAGKRVEEDVLSILASVADKTVASIKEESFITIDSRPLVGDNGEAWQIPYSQFKTVSELLDNIWFLLRPYGVPSMKYGVTWGLRDTTSGKLFKNMGRTWAQRRGRGELDVRSLSEVGVVPGMRLEAIPLERNTS